jgi:hypothetical protein
LLLALLVLGVGAEAQEIHVALTPEFGSVGLGAEFVVTIEITQPGLEFNGYEAVIGYDTSALTFLRQTPVSLQEGPLMTQACGNTFHVFQETAPGSLSVSHVLLCAGVSLTGPGVLYQLRFRAANEAQTTDIQFLEVPKFFDAGILVGPVMAMDASVQIGTTTDVGTPAGRRGPSVSAYPNPSREGVVIRAYASHAGAESLVIRDLAGRLVRRFPILSAGDEEWRVFWDGIDESGKRVAPGVYWISLSTDTGVARSRVVILR